MTFRTELHIPASPWQITHKDKLLLLGSCFADTIGERFQSAGFDVFVNPFGTLYNPASIAAVLTRLLEEKLFTPGEIIPFGAEGWGSWMSHSLLSRPTKEDALELHNSRLKEAAERLRSANVLFVTFGTAWVYRLAETSDVVANCHHEPASRFTRERLSVEEIVNLWQPFLARLHTLNPGLRVIFTVSPIRHLRDGAHDNQLSKSTLLLAVEQLQRLSDASDQTPHVAYFPSYELLLDDLRDYRFYAEDLCHPSSVAASYVWERFVETYFDETTRTLIARVDELTKALHHRPLHPDSSENRRFQKQTRAKLQALLNEHPYLKIAAI